jgi:glutaminyl-tRNA synthetase
VAKANSTVDIGMLEFAVRETLNRSAPRRMAVLRPLKIVIDNYPHGRSELLEAANHPDDPSQGTRRIPFGRELYIERDDFMENPPTKFFRLAPGREARLRYGYFITCREVVRNAAGDVVELRCSYDPATRGGDAPDGRKRCGCTIICSRRRSLTPPTSPRSSIPLRSGRFPAAGASRR